MTVSPGKLPPGGAAGIGARVTALTGARTLSVLAGFGTSVVGARLIGAEGMGAAAAAFTVATVSALLANGGLSQASIYFLNRTDLHPAGVAGRFLVLGLGSAALAGLTALVALAVAGELVGLATTTWLVTATLAAAIVAFEVSGSVLLGIHAARAYIVTQVVEAAAALVLTVVVLVAVSRSADGFVLAAAAAYGGAAFGAVVAARRFLGSILPGWDRQLARRALAFGLRGQVGNVLQFLNLRLDLLLVPALLDLRLAGLYFVAVRVSEVVILVANSAGSFLFPEVAAQHDRRATAVTERLTRATLLVVALGALATILVAEPLLVIAFGEAFAEGIGALRITAVAMLPLALSRVLSGDLKGRGYPGRVSLAAGTALVVTVVADLALIPLAGIEGAAVASLLAYSTGAAAMLWAYRRATGGSARALLPGPADVGSLLPAVRRLASRFLRPPRIPHVPGERGEAP